MELKISLSENEILELQNYLNFTNECSLEKSIEHIVAYPWILETPQGMNPLSLDNIFDKMYRQILQQVK